MSNIKQDVSTDITDISVEDQTVNENVLEEFNVDQLIQKSVDTSSSRQKDVSDSLSRFLDEANVSMMGGWT